MNGSAVMVEDLRKSFGDVEALKGIDFSVPEATVFGLLGPNGAGKTTAIRILSTTLHPDSGRAEVMGNDVVRKPKEVRSRIGLAGQNAAVDPHLTGRENLQLIGKLAHVPRKEISRRVDELLERFGLASAAGRTLKTYSGGMRRRLDVAAALVQRAPVLFLDEPTTGLDLQSRSELWEVIRELVKEGSTVLLTTQYLEEADQLADRIAVLDEGKVVADDTARVLKAQLGDTSIQIEMSDDEAGSKAQLVLSRIFEDHVSRNGRIVHLLSSQGPRALIKALSSLEASGLEAQNLSVREPTLDEVFLNLTGRSPERTAVGNEQGEEVSS